MSASAYFAMYGSGSFSLHLKHASCRMHAPCTSPQPHHWSQFFILYFCKVMLSAAATWVALGTTSMEQGKLGSPDSIHI